MFRIRSFELTSHPISIILLFFLVVQQLGFILGGSGPVQDARKQYQSMEDAHQHDTEIHSEIVQSEEG